MAARDGEAKEKISIPLFDWVISRIGMGRMMGKSQKPRVVTPLRLTCACFLARIPPLSGFPARALW